MAQRVKRNDAHFNLGNFKTNWAKFTKARVYQEQDWTDPKI